MPKKKYSYLQSFILAFAIMAAVPAAAEKTPADPSLVVAGWVERAIFPDHGLTFRAKLDTGAITSAINGTDVEIFDRDGKDLVRFSLKDDNGKSVVIESPVFRKQRIRRRVPGSEPIRRAVVLLKVCIGGVVKKAQFAIAKRPHFKYQLLIGRRLLAGRIAVRSGVMNIVSDKCAIK